MEIPQNQPSVSAETAQQLIARLMPTFPCLFLVPITRGANLHHQLLFFSSLYIVLTYITNFLELSVVDLY